MNWNIWPVAEANEPEYCEAIYQLAQYFEPVHGLEIGVRFGRSAYAFLKANLFSTLVGIDPNPEFPVEEFLAAHAVGDRFRFINEASPGALTKVEDQLFDWIYIDGLHDYQGVYLDFIGSWDLLAPGGVMIFDDYDDSLGYGTEVRQMLHDRCEQVTGQKFVYRTMGDFTRVPCPHKSAVLLK